MEAKLSATEQDISEVVIEIRETKEQLKTCVENDKDHLRDEIKRLSKREEQLRDEKKILLEQQIQPKGISSSNISSIILSFNNFFSNFLFFPFPYINFLRAR